MVKFLAKEKTMSRRVILKGPTELPPLVGSSSTLTTGRGRRGQVVEVYNNNVTPSMMMMPPQPMVNGQFYHHPYHPVPYPTYGPPMISVPGQQFYSYPVPMNHGHSSYLYGQATTYFHQQNGMMATGGSSYPWPNAEVNHPSHQFLNAEVSSSSRHSSNAEVRRSPRHSPNLKVDSSSRHPSDTEVSRSSGKLPNYVEVRRSPRHSPNVQVNSSSRHSSDGEVNRRPLRSGREVVTVEVESRKVNKKKPVQSKSIVQSSSSVLKKKSSPRAIKKSKGLKRKVVNKKKKLGQQKEVEDEVKEDETDADIPMMMMIKDDEDEVNKGLDDDDGAGSQIDDDGEISKKDNLNHNNIFTLAVSLQDEKEIDCSSCSSSSEDLDEQIVEGASELVQENEERVASTLIQKQQQEDVKAILHSMDKNSSVNKNDVEEDKKVELMMNLDGKLIESKVEAGQEQVTVEAGQEQVTVEAGQEQVTVEADQDKQEEITIVGLNSQISSDSQILDNLENLFKDATIIGDEVSLVPEAEKAEDMAVVRSSSPCPDLSQVEQEVHDEPYLDSTSLDSTKVITLIGDQDDELEKDDQDDEDQQEVMMPGKIFKDFDSTLLDIGCRNENWEESTISSPASLTPSPPSLLKEPMRRNNDNLFNLTNDDRDYEEGDCYTAYEAHCLNTSLPHFGPPGRGPKYRAGQSKVPAWRKKAGWIRSSVPLIWPKNFAELLHQSYFGIKKTSQDISYTSS